MGCNCNKKRTTTAKMVVSASRKFQLTRRDGTTATFGSRLEAEAERARAGGGSIRPA